MQTTTAALPLVDHHPETGTFRADVIDGLRRSQKEIPSKYFYDARGSALFDAICELEEYYPTRTEVAIMHRHGSAMAEALGARVLLVEYGSGTGLKTRILLEQLEDPAGYVPIDISRDYLVQAADKLAQAFPELLVQPVCADYTKPFPLPDMPVPFARTVVYYPGSTIGNFQPAQARAFLARIAELVGPGGGLLIGVDLKKEARILHAAYNDRTGVTAAFNKNVLARANRELGADFDLDRFRHRAFWNAEEGCIEMHLVSTADQTVAIGDEVIAFAEGETIRTEYSYKYTIDEFSALAAEAGLVVETVWTDEEDLFSVQYATVDAW